MGHLAIQLRYSGSTRATGVCCSMISLTSTAQGVTPGARQGRSRAFRAYQASTGSAKDVDMMLPIVARAPGRRGRAPAARPAAASRPRSRSAWNRTISLPGCVTVASSARPGPYQVQARDASAASPFRTFKLARWPRKRPTSGPLGLGAQDGGERLADVVHLLHLHQVGKAVGALQGRS